MALDPFEIIIGTYEQYLLGYKVNRIVNEYKMGKSFATHSHVGSIRSVANNKHYLASAGADDSVYLYDLRYRVESGKLMHHNDTVNCVAFTPEASHLFTCSNDGSIAAIRCGNWQVEKHWLKPHKGLAVNTLAIHPTGKIALSTGADGILRTWNLVKGRQAYATNLAPRLKLDAKHVNVLKWSPNGEKYLLAVNQRIDVYSVELAGIDSEIKFDSKIICVEFLKDDLIAVGLENGQIKFYDLEKSVQTIDVIAHDIRVKCMAFKDDLLITASSSGEIKLWRYNRHKLDMLQKINCDARITCLSLSCKNLAYNKEVQLEKEEQECSRRLPLLSDTSVTNERKLKLRQEIIVEKEGDWEITSIDALQKLSEKKSKKKRSIEEIQALSIPSKRNRSILKKRKARKSDATNDDHIPKKKNKLLISNNDDSDKYEHENENHALKKKRKKLPKLFEENNNIPFKKMKKMKKKVSEQSNTVVISKNSKMKLTGPHQQDINVSPKKRKKEMVVKDGAILKKKKKKQ
ncbi:p21-activated protein kinase-interacting protein 1-like [Xylocopa sonorina]|uniref:p21-activated protein kinase-interacting protein 1-like n=1 Tax=Xylocopa sonorina TaxID=1818115 RepID=UPI00403AB985